MARNVDTRKAPSKETEANEPVRLVVWCIGVLRNLSDLRQAPPPAVFSRYLPSSFVGKGAT